MGENNRIETIPMLGDIGSEQFRSPRSKQLYPHTLYHISNSPLSRQTANLVNDILLFNSQNGARMLPEFSRLESAPDEQCVSSAQKLETAIVDVT